VEREKFQVDVEKWIKGKVSSVLPFESLSNGSAYMLTSGHQVARHKYLRGGVVAVDAIPKSAAGKILRKELREWAKKELESGDSERARL